MAISNPEDLTTQSSSKVRATSFTLDENTEISVPVHFGIFVSRLLESSFSLTFDEGPHRKANIHTNKARERGL